MLGQHVTCKDFHIADNYVQFGLYSKLKTMNSLEYEISGAKNNKQVWDLTFELLNKLFQKGDHTDVFNMF